MWWISLFSLLAALLAITLGFTRDKPGPNVREQQEDRRNPPDDGPGNGPWNGAGGVFY